MKSDTAMVAVAMVIIKMMNTITSSISSHKIVVVIVVIKMNKPLGLFIEISSIKNPRQLVK